MENAILLSNILRSYWLNIFWRICASCHSPLIGLTHVWLIFCWHIFHACNRIDVISGVSKKKASILIHNKHWVLASISLWVASASVSFAHIQQGEGKRFSPTRITFLLLFLSSYLLVTVWLDFHPSSVKAEKCCRYSGWCSCSCVCIPDRKVCCHLCIVSYFMSAMYTVRESNSHNTRRHA